MRLLFKDENSKEQEVVRSAEDAVRLLYRHHSHQQLLQNQQLLHYRLVFYAIVLYLLYFLYATKYKIYTHFYKQI